MSDLDLTKPDINFGIHKYNERLWTNGFVGVGRLYSHDQTLIQSNGKEHIVVISSQYGMYIGLNKRHPEISRKFYKFP